MTHNQTTDAITLRLLDLILPPKRRLDTRALNKIFELGVPHGHQERLMRALFRKERGRYLPKDAVPLLTEEKAIRLAWKSSRHEDNAFWNNPFTPIDILVKLVPERLHIEKPHHEAQQSLSQEQLEVLARKRTTQHLWSLGPRSKAQSAAVLKVLQHANDGQRLPAHLWQLTTPDAVKLATRIDRLNVKFTSALFTELDAARETPDHPFHAAAQCKWFSDAIDQIAVLIESLPNLDAAKLRVAERCLTGAVDAQLWLPCVALNPHGSALLQDRWLTHKEALADLPVRSLASLFQTEPLAAAQVLNQGYLKQGLLVSLLHHGLVPAQAVGCLTQDRLLDLAREAPVKNGWPKPQPSNGMRPQGAERSDLDELKAYALRFGGDSSAGFGAFQRPEILASEVPPDLCARLLKVQPVSGKGARLVQMRRNGCHANSLALAAAKAGRKAMTGLALSEDGIWRSHSWVLDGARILETTTPRTLYLGVEAAPGDLD